MKESTTYQAILEEGRQEGRHEGRHEGAVATARKFLLRFGTQRLGKPSAAIRNRISQLTDVDDLERLCVTTSRAGTWKELLSLSQEANSEVAE